MLNVPLIGILGSGGSDEVPAYTIDLALEVGREIASRGAICMSGGMSGVMNAVSKGARVAGGLVVGITPVLDRRECSPYLTVAITTGLGTVRNLLNVRAPDSLITVAGGFGTLNELLLAYQDNKPAVVLEGSGGWSDRLRSVLLEETYFDERRKARIYFATSPAEAVDLAVELSGETLPGTARLVPPVDPMDQPPHIGVLTPGTSDPATPLAARTLEIARQVGEEIAKQGAVTVCDAGHAAQAEVGRGANEAGGLVVGILGSLSKSDANAHVTVPIRTGLGEAAYPLTIRASDALVMVGGDSTTINQLTLCYYHYRPVVVVKGSGGWADRLPTALWHGKYLDWRKNLEIRFADTAQEAVELALRLGYKAPSRVDPKFDLPD